MISCSDLRTGSCKARISDLSVHGLSLILKEKVPVSAMVRVEWVTATFVGEVVYCQPHGKEFLVGLKVEDSVYETARKYANQ